MAIRLARYGAHVWIAARGEAKLQAALERIKEAAIGDSQRFGMSTVDVSDKADVERVAEEIIVLGASISSSTTLNAPGHRDGNADDIFGSMMDVNYFARFVTTPLPALRAQNKGISAMSPRCSGLWVSTSCLRRE